MNLMVPFETVGLPAHIAGLQGVSGDDLTAGASGGFPVVSIKGKVFHIKRGDDNQLVERPGEPGVPASSIEVVILRANPALSKTYYATGYTEGADEKPTCYSEDGVKPAADAAEKQSTTCGGCPHNAWGSRVTEQSTKAKACGDVRRLAVAPVGQVNDPMLLRVPAASLKPLAEYGKKLKQRGVAYPSVSTKISFDFSVSHPALTFEPVSFITSDMAEQVKEMIPSDMVLKILGMNSAPASTPVPAGGHQHVMPAGGHQHVMPALPAPTPPPAQAIPQAAPVPPVAAPKPPKAAPAKTKATPTQSSAFSSGPAAPAPVAPKPAVAPAQASKLVDVSIDADLAAVLSQAGFDDVAA